MVAQRRDRAPDRSGAVVRPCVTDADIGRLYLAAAVLALYLTIDLMVELLKRWRNDD